MRDQLFSASPLRLLLVAVAINGIAADRALAADLSEAINLMQRQDYVSAEPMLREILQTQSDPQADYLLGFLLIETFRFEEAEPRLVRATNAQPGNHHWLMVLAKSQLEQSKNIAAGRTLQRAIDLEPQPAYYFAHAMAALNTGDVRSAESSLRACLRMDPKHGEALYGLGGLLLDQGRTEQGIAFLEQAKTSSPENIDAWYRLGSAYRSTGRLREAQSLLEAVIEKIPGHVGALHNLSRVLLESGENDEATVVLERFAAMSELRDQIDFNESAVRKNPDNVDGRLYLAILYLRAGRAQDALTALLTARKLAPRDARIYRALGEAYRGLGDNNNAERAERFAASIGG